ncbi:hypothetical protein E2C01_060832 [Portunus trituberculatus]|uniref:Uncharacterized protein n=1 Tax=Portunus trituberculatus TaxID=210409 RepID=A0A5B7H294_PORTR|nr:hypothetical protein [Portunus trituberculatus]
MVLARSASVLPPCCPLLRLGVYWHFHLTSPMTRPHRSPHDLTRTTTSKTPPLHPPFCEPPPPPPPLLLLLL